jgi:hypothetical protein
MCRRIAVFSSGGRKFKTCLYSPLGCLTLKMETIRSCQTSVAAANQQWIKSQNVWIFSNINFRTSNLTFTLSYSSLKRFSSHVYDGKHAGCKYRPMEGDASSLKLQFQCIPSPIIIITSDRCRIAILFLLFILIVFLIFSRSSRCYFVKRKRLVL